MKNAVSGIIKYIPVNDNLNNAQDVPLDDTRQSIQNAAQDVALDNTRQSILNDINFNEESTESLKNAVSGIIKYIPVNDNLNNAQDVPLDNTRQSIQNAAQDVALNSMEQLIQTFVVKPLKGNEKDKENTRKPSEANFVTLMLVLSGIAYPTGKRDAETEEITTTKDVSELSVQEACNYWKALDKLFGDKTRFKVLMALPPDKSKTTRQLEEETGIDQELIKYHLDYLKSLYLVEARGRPAKYGRTERLTKLLNDIAVAFGIKNGV